jgi:hypothetical protein
VTLKVKLPLSLIVILPITDCSLEPECINFTIIVIIGIYKYSPTALAVRARCARHISNHYYILQSSPSP